MEGIWPLIVIWVLFSIFGSRKKKPPQQEDAPPGERPASLPDQFRLALEELKRAEQDAIRRQQASAPPAPAAPPPMVRRSSATKQFTPRSFQPKSAGPARGRFVQRQPLAPMADDAEMSSEDVFTPEGQADYDEEAEKVIAERRKAADRLSTRRPGSIEELTPEQLARRGSRPDTAIGGRQEHDAWHEALQASGKPESRTAARRSPLARYADGTMKSAIIITEILGTPKGQQ